MEMRNNVYPAVLEIYKKKKKKARQKGGESNRKQKKKKISRARVKPILFAPHTCIQYFMAECMFCFLLSLFFSFFFVWVCETTTTYSKRQFIL